MKKDKFSLRPFRKKYRIYYIGARRYEKDGYGFCEQCALIFLRCHYYEVK